MLPISHALLAPNVQNIASTSSSPPTIRPSPLQTATKPLTQEFVKLNPCANTELHKFWNETLETIVQQRIDQGRDPLPQNAQEMKTLEKILEKIEITPMQQEWIKALSESLLKEIPPLSQIKHQRACQRAQVVTRFFPNLAHIFLRAFNLLNAARPPDSLYEYAHLVGLYINFFIILKEVIKALSCFVEGPLKVALVASGTLATFTGASYIYLRWMQGTPSKIDYCQRVEIDPSERVLCREVEFAQAKSSSSLMIIGETGVGKSKFLKGLAARMKGKTVFQFNNALLFGSTSYGHSAAEKMWGSFLQARGWEDEIVFFCDEFGDASKNKASDIALCLKPVLDNPKIQLVGALTENQWKELIEHDPSFARRFKDIHFKGMNDEQTGIVIEDLIEQEGSHLSISHCAVEEIIASTTARKPELQQPNKAVQVVKQIIYNMNTLDIDDYVSPKLQSAQLELSRLKEQAKRADSPFFHPQGYPAYLAALNAAKNSLIEAQKELDQQKTLAKVMKNCVQWQKKLDRETRQDARQSHYGRVVFKSFYLRPLLIQKIEEVKKTLDKALYSCVDKEYVGHVLERM